MASTGYFSGIITNNLTGNTGYFNLLTTAGGITSSTIYVGLTGN